ncbi:MAG: hypothetical protein MR319_08430 [Mediterranea sp.]|nr:hypothetical protein [Mediterranea sp.]
MRRCRKSTSLCLFLLLYVTAMALYFLPRNVELDLQQKWLTVAASYFVVLLLWWVLRKRESLNEKNNVKKD